MKMTLSATEESVLVIALLSDADPIHVDLEAMLRELPRGVQEDLEHRLVDVHKHRRVRACVRDGR